MSNWRAIKFAVITRLLAPVGIRLMGLWMRTWKFEPGTDAVIGEVCAKGRLIVATLHGSAFPLLPLAGLAARHNRVVCAMTSPSRDGMLQDLVIGYFGVKAVKGSSRSKGTAGSLGLINAIREGQAGLLAVDGPRGPVGVPKEGIARLARAADATIVCLSVGATRFLQFGSWDGLFLPLPFARICYHITLIPPHTGEEQPVEALLAEIQDRLYEGTVAAESPIARRLTPRSTA